MNGNTQKIHLNAADVYADIVGQIYKQQISSSESELWTRIIEEFGDEAVIKFLYHHLETSAFAPKPSDLYTLFKPQQKNSVAAYEELSRSVGKIGPYENPTFEDTAIAGAVELLGGWIKVNEQMPDASLRFEYEAFYKRFDSLYQQSCSNLMLGKGFSGQLLGLHAVGNLLDKTQPEKIENSSVRMLK